jgi:N-acetylmuramoyl-L-alanine amidase
LRSVFTPQLLKIIFALLIKNFAFLPLCIKVFAVKGRNLISVLNIDMMPFKFKNALLLLMVIMISGCASHQSYVPTLRPGFDQPSPAVFTPFTHPQTIEHIVGPYESLWRISKTYDVSIDTLMRVNGLVDPDRLEKGQVLVIPNTLGPRPEIPYIETSRWTHIVIHHTATHDGNAFTIDQMHKRWKNGMGYHFLIDNGTAGKQPGQIEVGPRWMKQGDGVDGAHANADKMNKRGIGIALVGNFSQSNVSSEQFNALIYLVNTLRSYYDIPKGNIIRHQDVKGKHTECPGLNFPWIEFIQSL